MKPKCIETRRCEGYTRRRYRMPDGSTRTTYEFGEPLVFRGDIVRLIRKAAAGRRNLPPNKSKFRTDPDKIDAVVGMLDAGKSYAEISQAFNISSKTIARIRYGR
jgi:hypothetical protein